MKHDTLSCALCSQPLMVKTGASFLEYDPEADDDADDPEAEAEAEAAPCPACGAENAPMGKLGRKTHYNCRACGAWYE